MDTALISNETKIIKSMFALGTDIHFGEVYITPRLAQRFALCDSSSFKVVKTNEVIVL